jgi:hypothetical protein
MDGASGRVRKPTPDREWGVAVRPLPPVFRAVLEAHGLPLPVAEWKFHPTRKWRWDWAWVDAKVALEQQGGLWSFGRHSRPEGQLSDFEKFSEGAALGWRLILVQPKDLCSPRTLEWIRQCLAQAA